MAEPGVLPDARGAGSPHPRRYKVPFTSLPFTLRSPFMLICSQHFSCHPSAQKLSVAPYFLLNTQHFHFEDGETKPRRNETSIPKDATGKWLIVV